MKWWIEKPHHHWPTFHRIKDPFEILTLELPKDIECQITLLRGIGQNHFTHCVDAIFGEKHVLCSHKANPLRAESNCTFGVVWSVRIGVNLELSNLVRPPHEHFI